MAPSALTSGGPKGFRRLLSAPLPKVFNFSWFHGKPICWQNAPKETWSPLSFPPIGGLERGGLVVEEGFPIYPQEAGAQIPNQQSQPQPEWGHPNKDSAALKVQT